MENPTVLGQTTKGKKLVFAIPPLLDKLNQFDLENKERFICANSKYAAYSPGAFRSNAIPANVSLESIAPSRPSTCKKYIPSPQHSIWATFEVVVLTAHSPFELHVDANAIREGYDKKLCASQGEKRVW